MISVQDFDWLAKVEVVGDEEKEGQLALAQQQSIDGHTHRRQRVAAKKNNKNRFDRIVLIPTDTHQI